MVLNFRDVFFFSCFHLYGNLPYPPPFSPFLRRPLLIPCHFLLYRQSYPPPHENVTAAILSYAVSHLHEGTGKLRKTRADTSGHLTESVPSLTVSEKWPRAQRFDVQAADRRSPIQVLTQLDLGDLLAPDAYHTPNTVGTYIKYLCRLPAPLAPGAARIFQNIVERVRQFPKMLPQRSRYAKRFICFQYIRQKKTERVFFITASINAHKWTFAGTLL